MRAFFVVVLALCLSLYAWAGEEPASAQTGAESLNLPELITEPEGLPKSVDLGEFVRVNEALGSRLDILLKAASVEGEVNAQCEVTCDHEIGGITCPVGKQCSCGCPGGYAYCSCRN
ncbi:hypothetical protein [Chiayiivirga flava]|uniref:EGF-like domain-containing protein n=1 Tax=Chiayiivirga flava TaxID=659595 RepID=A0A7W8D5M3_9GAMM|nr:hypothetical protein [Chiayiivirga flava]MBB5208363.1 hypothetical protein [Chiayiivirga flava]